MQRLRGLPHRCLNLPFVAHTCRRVGAGSVIVLFAGCWTDPRVPVTVYAIEPLEVFASVHHTGDHLVEPLGLKVIGGDLLILDRGGARNVHVIDAATGSLRASLGPVGEGEGEFREPVAISADPAGNVWVIDGTNERASRIDLSRLDDGGDWLGEMISLASPGIVLDAEWTADGTLLAEGVFPGGRFGLFSNAGEFLGPVGNLSAEASAAPTRLMYYASIAAHPDLSRLVAASQWYPRVEIVGADGRTLGFAEVPVHTEPVLVPFQSGLRASDDSPNVYEDVATTSEYIFALYSGRTVNRHAPYQHFGRDVHVFGWDGSLVTILRLDRDALALAVDEANGWLFTIEYDPVPAILRYGLPALRDGQ